MLRAMIERHKLSKVLAEAAETEARLERLYAQLKDDRGNSPAEFKAYCDRWGVDYEALMTEARATIANEAARRAERRAARRAAR